MASNSNTPPSLFNPSTSAAGQQSINDYYFSSPSTSTNYIPLNSQMKKSPSVGCEEEDDDDEITILEDFPHSQVISPIDSMTITAIQNDGITSSRKVEVVKQHQLKRKRERESESEEDRQAKRRELASMKREEEENNVLRGKQFNLTYIIIVIILSKIMYIR